MKNSLYALILFFLCAVFYSCNTDNNSTVPNAPVNIYLNLTTTYNTFNIPTQYLLFEKKDEAAGVYLTGYAGVIVSVDYERRYCAFDMCCPYEKSSDVKVYPDVTGGSAVCEKCGSEFDLAFGLGQLRSGPAKENLRRYNTSVYSSKGSQILRIYH